MFVAWILSVMFFLQPSAPWVDTYPETAFAIADATDDPVEAMRLVAIAHFESHFDPNAIGDHGRSFGLWQINPGTAQTKALDLLTPGPAAVIALRLVRQSFKICKARPPLERLAWYAAGGPGCSDRERPVRLSRHRLALAARLIEERKESALDRD